MCYLYRAGVLPGSNVWVGAWWLGFLMTGLTLIIVALPLLAFPSELPGMVCCAMSLL